ncbi:M20/M25/M40 family metallo-hydrolase [Eubacteriales bacterium OttesenSCG-928-K08]|nr:M20/M25/M40 family metallo-hydrolase [Eubacteriales bacterium OttesenSCG-928-K08]
MTSTKQQLIEWVDAHQEECIAFLQDLVRIPSENRVPDGDELACQNYVLQTFRAMGLKTDSFLPDEVENIQTCEGFLPGRNYADRPDVVGILHGGGGGKKIMLTAHIDVVPAGDPALWENNDPWSGMVQHGKLFGRGSADDKSGVAAMTMVVRAFQDCNVSLKSDLVLASVVDEESGGANGALAAVLKYPCDYYFNADGLAGQFNPVSLSGGRFRIDVETIGPNPCSRNCLDAMVILYEELRALEQIKREEFRARPVFDKSAESLDVYRVMEFHAGNEDDSTQNIHGNIKTYVYSTENKETNRAQIEAIIDRAYARMDQRKLKRPTLQFYRRFFTGANTDSANPLVQSCLSNYKLVTGKEGAVSSAFISDQAVISEFGGGLTIGLGASGSLDEPNAFHQPNEAVKIEDYLNLIKIMALSVLDLDQMAEA